MTVRTRFAPSPTGFLHIGGARTALFNFLFARHHGGQYLLRIEDTDKARSTKEAVQQILLSLEWLGLSPDEPPVYQSAREARHVEVAQALLAKGAAYLAYDTMEELAAQRAAAESEKRPFRYDGSRWINGAAPPKGVSPVIRIKAPRSGETTVQDLVQGEVRVGHAELDDMIILRSDGTPTYLHAVVVDDHDMAITHVIRGDDHLTNTFRQCMVFDAMGWDRPAFAHIPLIHGADGAKLSKRHGAVGVEELQAQGFLPEAVCNYLLRLGWGRGDEEFVPRDRAVALFDLADVGRSASRMDYAKLTHLNGQYLRQTDDAPLVALVTARLGAPDEQGRIAALMPVLKERAKSLNDIVAGVAFALRDGPPTLDQKAATLLTTDARSLLLAVVDAFSAVEWTAEALMDCVRSLAETHGVKLGALAQPMRAALTGSTTSPPVDAVLVALGKAESLARLRHAVQAPV